MSARVLAWAFYMTTTQSGFYVQPVGWSDMFPTHAACEAARAAVALPSTTHTHPCEPVPIMDVL